MILAVDINPLHSPGHYSCGQTYNILVCLALVLDCHLRISARHWHLRRHMCCPPSMHKHKQAYTLVRHANDQAMQQTTCRAQRLLLEFDTLCPHC